MLSEASATVRAKALSYLTAGRVTVTEAGNGGWFTAIVAGDSGTHLVWRTGVARTWSCTCPAHEGCSHQLAVALVAG